MNKLIFSAILLLTLSTGISQTSNMYVEASKRFLEELKDGKNTDETVNKIAGFSQEELVEGLQTDNERLAFWINIYNGFIQRILKANPEYYEDRGKFFKEKFIDIAGRKMAFAEIEHGIIRHSQFEYFLGYITNPFAPGWERKLRVKDKDWRIHFALNCGAKSCPPVAIYDDVMINDQLNKSTKKYLERVTEVDENEQAVYSTKLFSWFRGDFGGKSGAKDILQRFNIIDNTDLELKFQNYDWTLDLDNYIEL